MLIQYLCTPEMGVRSICAHAVICLWRAIVCACATLAASKIIVGKLLCVATTAANIASLGDGYISRTTSTTSHQ